MYCIKLSILPYQLFMFNDFNDLETFRASNKRTSSDFNKYLKYLNIFKITSSNNGYRPSSPKTAIFVVLLPTPRENLQNLICTFSCFMFLLKLNRKHSSLLILLTIDVPHTSLPYNSTGFTVWSNSYNLIFISAYVIPITSKVGHKVTLVCPVMQLGNSSIIWYGPPNGNTLIANGTEVNPRLSSIAIVGNHTIGEYNLQLYSLTTFDAGVYRCDMIHKGSERFQGFRLMFSN